MGLETKLTQASRDGGVDCVAWDMRPVVGGKVIVQAKRYRHTVGVSAVRDLYGTVMNEGAVCQVGTQRDLYERPADRFVAGFVGRSTFLAGAIEAPGRFRTDGGLVLACAGPHSGRGVLALRPERLQVAAAPMSALDNRLPGTVEFVSYLGALIDIHVRLSPADRLVVQIANREGGFAPEVGQSVHVGWPASAGLVFAG